MLVFPVKGNRKRERESCLVSFSLFPRVNRITTGPIRSGYTLRTERETITGNLPFQMTSLLGRNCEQSDCDSIFFVLVLPSHFVMLLRSKCATPILDALFSSSQRLECCTSEPVNKGNLYVRAWDFYIFTFFPNWLQRGIFFSYLVLMPKARSF